MDGVAPANHSARYYPAKHAAAAPEFFAQAGPDSLHLIAGRADGAHFQLRPADAQQLSQFQTIHVQAVRRNVFVDQSRVQAHGLQGFAVHQKDLPRSSRPRVCAALEPEIRHRADFQKFLHRQMLLWRAEEIQDTGHGSQSPAAVKRE